MALAPKKYTRNALRVLVVDDLGFMRMALRHIVESDGDMRVVGEARDGEEAVALAHQLQPDVITMDIEMPKMDGIEATRRIAAEVSPRPIVIMVSSHTQAGAAATIRALRQGASDFVSKHSAFADTDLAHIDAELRNKIRILAQHHGASPARREQNPTAAPIRTACVPARPVDLIVIGVSTGGPATLATLLRAVGPLSAPIVIAQHMPQFFTSCLAQSLTVDTGITVREGDHRQPVAAGEVTILPGGGDAVLAPCAEGGFELRLAHADGAVHPSADLLFQSAAMAARQPVAVILTGMGDDGTQGASHFVHRNLPVLVQRPHSCIVGGMPGAAIEAGVASESLSLDEIAVRLRRWTAPAFPSHNAEMVNP